MASRAKPWWYGVISQSATWNRRRHEARAKPRPGNLDGRVFRLRLEAKEAPTPARTLVDKTGRYLEGHRAVSRAGHERSHKITHRRSHTHTYRCTTTCMPTRTVKGISTAQRSRYPGELTFTRVSAFSRYVTPSYSSRPGRRERTGRTPPSPTRHPAQLCEYIDRSSLAEIRRPDCEAVSFAPP